MLAYEALEADTNAVMAYDDHKRQEKQRKKIAPISGAI